MFNFNLPLMDIASVESAVIPYPMFYRRVGVRRAVQLVSPPISRLRALELPRDSIYHYVGDETTQYGPDQTGLVLKDQARIVMVEHIQELGDQKGPPRRMPVPPGGLIRDYHRRNRQTRPLLKPEIALRDPRTLIVQNYALLPHLYRYMANAYTGYNRWWNAQCAIWDRVDHYGKISDRQQYLICQVPKHLPTLSLLRRGEVNMSRQLLEKFRDPNLLFVLEVWKWLGAYREESMISRASPESLAKMNLIWVDGDRWFLVSMGNLQAWRKATPAEVNAGADADAGIVDASMMQKRFLRALMVMADLRVDPQGEDVDSDGAAKTDGDPVVETPATAEGDDGETPTPDVPSPGTVTIDVEQPDGTVKKVKIRGNMDPDALGEDPVEETEANQARIDQQIEEELAQLDRFYQEQREKAKALSDELDTDVLTDESLELAEEIFAMPEDEPQPMIDGTPQTLDEAFIAKAEALAASGTISAPELNRLIKIASVYKTLPNPHGNGTLAEHSVVTEKDLVLHHDPIMPDNMTVVDKGMLSSSVETFDANYIENVMSKDISSMVLNVQNAGLAVTDYRVEEHEDAMGSYQIHKVQFTPVRGKVSTVEFRIPTVSPDGTFRANGVRYRQRKQRAEVPIRKVSPDKVALTSYYSRVFVVRSEKQVNNYPGWLTNQIAARGMDTEDNRVTLLTLSKVWDPTTRAPRIYSILADRFRSFETGGVFFYLDYASRKSEFGEAAVKMAESEGGTVIGRRGKQLVVVDYHDALYVVGPKGLEPIGTFESIAGIEGMGPMERAEIKVFGKLIPVGVFLAYQMGLTRLAELLGVKPRIVPAGERLNMADDEYALRFEDESWVIRRDRKQATLILGGFLAFEKLIRNYPAHLFDRKDVYASVLEQSKIGMRYLREMDLMVEMFIDPITRGILEEMKEPTSFVPLVQRAVQLLETDWAPDETDMAYMRVRGYERMAGAVYSELVQSVRRMRASGNPGIAKMDMPPYVVHQLIQQDPAVKVVEESNPIHNLREREELTYSGEGGRGARSMVEGTRSFHQNDLGVVSESSKDSADVGVTTFLSADPNLTSLRGLTSRADPSTTSATQILSTSALLAPGADRDDGKRVMFVSIQNSSGTFADGYRAMPFRTGYETVMAARVDDLYAQTAKQKGKVVDVTDSAITVEYADGTSATFQLGRRYGTVASLILPHQLETGLKPGDKFDAGDLLIYNTRYFEPDAANPRLAAWKQGLLVKTALAETNDTLEDSAAISEEVAKLMETEVTTMRTLTVSFRQGIHRLVKPGDEVDFDTILCTIDDMADSGSAVMDEDSIDTLRVIAANTPRAKIKGVVEKIEVFYNGDIDDMTDSLQEITNTSERNRKRFYRDMRKPFISGRVDESMRVEGNPLLLDNAVIRIYITERVGAGVGDKGVFANQLKTVFGRVMSGVNETESGEPIGAIFGYLSVANRIVTSPELIGTTNSLLLRLSKSVSDIYFGK